MCIEIKRLFQGLHNNLSWILTWDSINNYCERICCTFPVLNVVLYVFKK